MRYLVTGANGMLAHDVMDVFSHLQPIGLTHNDLDITDLAAVLATVESGDVVINCAAFNAVDDAETAAKQAYLVNADGPSVLAEALRERGGKLIHFSTDYVFSGDSQTPYLESEARSPRSVYGKSKALGEINALSKHPVGAYVVRTAWLYGKNGSNFAGKILERAQTGQPIQVVNDQIGQPTWTRDLAYKALELITTDAPAGIYHGTNAGEASWFEFAQAVVEEAGFTPDIVTPMASTDLVRAAPRPMYSVLSHGRWSSVGIEPMRNWREALHDAFTAGVFTDKTDTSGL